MALRPVPRRAVGVVAGQRLAVVGPLVAEAAAERLGEGLVPHHALEEVVGQLVAEVPDHGAVGLAHLAAAADDLGRVGLAHVDRHEARRVPHRHRRLAAAHDLREQVEAGPRPGVRVAQPAPAGEVRQHPALGRLGPGPERLVVLRPGLRGSPRSCRRTGRAGPPPTPSSCRRWPRGWRRSSRPARSARPPGRTPPRRRRRSAGSRRTGRPRRRGSGRCAWRAGPSGRGARARLRRNAPAARGLHARGTVRSPGLRGGARPSGRPRRSGPRGHHGGRRGCSAGGAVRGRDPRGVRAPRRRCREPIARGRLPARAPRRDGPRDRLRCAQPGGADRDGHPARERGPTPPRGHPATRIGPRRTSARREDDVSPGDGWTSILRGLEGAPSPPSRAPGLSFAPARAVMLPARRPSRARAVRAAPQTIISTSPRPRQARLPGWCRLGSACGVRRPLRPGREPGDGLPGTETESRSPPRRPTWATRPMSRPLPATSAHRSTGAGPMRPCAGARRTRRGPTRGPRPRHAAAGPTMPPPEDARPGRRQGDGDPFRRHHIGGPAVTRGPPPAASGAAGARRPTAAPAAAWACRAPTAPRSLEPRGHPARRGPLDGTASARP